MNDTSFLLIFQPNHWHSLIMTLPYLEAVPIQEIHGNGPCFPCDKMLYRPAPSIHVMKISNDFQIIKEFRAESPR
jgi:hypothetical protein